MNTVGTPLLWGGFAVVVVIMLSIDLLLQGRRGAYYVDETSGRMVNPVGNALATV